MMPSTPDRTLSARVRRERIAEAVTELGTAYGALRVAEQSLPPSMLKDAVGRLAEAMAAALGHENLVHALSPREGLSLIARRMEHRVRALGEV